MQTPINSKKLSSRRSRRTRSCSRKMHRRRDLTRYPHHSFERIGRFNRNEVFSMHIVLDWVASSRSLFEYRTMIVHGCVVVQRNIRKVDRNEITLNDSCHHAAQCHVGSHSTGPARTRALTKDSCAPARLCVPLSFSLYSSFWIESFVRIFLRR